MKSIYLPTIELPLWPCAVLLVLFIPLSIWHESHWKRTLRDYSAARLAAGATDAEWPQGDLPWVLSLQPALISVAALLLAVMVGLGWANLLAWPRTVPGFRIPLNYYDRPYMAAMLAAGTSALIAALALVLDLRRSPWRAVARRIRRATHAPAQTREVLFSAALEVDPGVAQALAEAGRQVASDESVAPAVDPATPDA